MKGHQDDKCLGRPYTRNEKLNIEMDALAKRCWNQVYYANADEFLPLPPQHPVHGEGWQLWMGEVKVNNPKTDTLYKMIHQPITQSWWERHNHVSPVAKQLIDWEMLEIIMASLPQWLQQWVSKTASENCGVGTTLVGWNKQDDAKCP